MSDMRPSPHRQQTVKLAIDCATGELLQAETLLSLEESVFTALRRAAMTARVARRRGDSGAKVFQCALCKHPVFLSRHYKAQGNRWFVHDGASEQCPWHEGNRLSPDQTKALIYRGQQEGVHHLEMKRFIAGWLEKDTSVSKVGQEKTTISEVVKGEWRRPDVQCLYQDIPLVLEIQLSYTFLSDVIARDAFYHREGIFIIWIFASFDRNRATVTDEAFFNRRNVFVLDAEAMNQTVERQVLTFNGFRQEPRLVDDKIVNVWSSALIGLRELSFPSDTMRPYFFDYDLARQKVESARMEAWRKQQIRKWNLGIQEYLDSALRFYHSDYASDLKAPVLTAAEFLQDNTHWHRGFEALNSEYLFGWHGVLPVLLSIKLNKPVGYKLQSVYQVIEVGLRSGGRGTPHAFSILFLWAYKLWKPTVSDKNRKWLKDYAHKVKLSIEAGETTYRRMTAFDEAIGLLFPELDKELATSFGTDRAASIDPIDGDPAEEMSSPYPNVHRPQV